MKKIYTAILVLAININLGIAQNTENQVPCADALLNADLTYPSDDPYVEAGPLEVPVSNPSVNELPPGPPPPPGGSEDRLISWIHGLGGGDPSWLVASEEIEKVYQTVQDRPFYLQPNWEESTENLLEDAREGTYHAVTTNNLDAKRSFVIAHSLGGLISRQIQQRIEDNPIPDNENTFFGLITVGTPHKGAPIVDNFDEIGNLILEGIEKLSTAYIYEEIQNSILGINLIEDFVEAVSGIDTDDPWNLIQNLGNIQFEDLFEDLWESIIALQDPGVATDLSPSSQRINSLQSYVNNLPSIAMYGVEDDPAILRFISEDPNSDMPWSDNQDDEMVIKVDDIALELWTKQVFYNEAYINYQDGTCNYWQWALDLAFNYGVACALLEVINSLENWSEVEFWRARNYFSSANAWVLDLDNQWKLLTGAAVMQEELGYYACNCVERDVNGNIIGNYGYPVDHPIDCYSNDSNTTCSETPVMSFYFEQIDQYDGVVTARSAMGFPNVGDRRELDSSNHKQMKNNQSLKDKLEQSFDGNSGDFFSTKVR